MARYIYLGDHFTDPRYVKAQCDPVRRPDGKCICGRNATMLVTFDGVEPVVVLRRRLRVQAGAR